MATEGAGALAEHDEIKRDSMLRAADRFLKRSNHEALAFRRIRIGETEGERSLGTSSSRSKGSNQTQGIN
jgi:hypothetical protein